MSSQPDETLTADEPAIEALALAEQLTTFAGEDLHVRLVLAADGGRDLTIDASAVQMVGQAALQLLVAAREEMARTGRSFTIVNPSTAFAERVRACRLDTLLGLPSLCGDQA